MAKIFTYWRKSFSLTLFLLLAISYLILRAECLGSEAAGMVCLNQAAPLFTTLVEFGAPIHRDARVWYISASCFAGFLALIICIVTLTKSRSDRTQIILYFSAVLFGIAADFASSRLLPYEVIAGYSIAVLLALVSFSLKKSATSGLAGSNNRFFHTSPDKTPISCGEAIALAVVFFLIVMVRFYALNRLPSGWDDEACPHRLIASSWDQILRQAIGHGTQQSAGLSWAALHNLFTRVLDPEFFLIDQRLLGVAISLGNCWIVYFFTRLLAGPLAAFFALILFAFGPLELGWSRQPTLHNFPILIAMLVAWLTMLAVLKKSWVYFVLLMLLMPVTHFVYPSARLMFVVPIITVISSLCFSCSAWNGHKKKIILIFFGAFLWCASRSAINWYVTGEFKLLSPVGAAAGYLSAGQSIHSFFSFASKIGVEFAGFLSSVFFRQIAPTHWEEPATFEPRRAISSCVAIFSLIGALRLLRWIKDPFSIMVLVFILMGLAPGLMTAMADRRAGAALMMLIILASLECTRVLLFVKEKTGDIWGRVFIFSTVLSLFVGMIFLQEVSYFRQPKMRAIQLQFADAIRPRIKDDTLVVYFGPMQCDILLELFDKLDSSNGSTAFVSPPPIRGGTLEEHDILLIKEPKVDVKAWFYAGHWPNFKSPLERQIPFLREKREWKNLLFISQWDDKLTQQIIDNLKEAFPTGKFEKQLFTPTSHQLSFFSVEK